MAEHSPAYVGLANRIRRGAVIAAVFLAAAFLTAWVGAAGPQAGIFQSTVRSEATPLPPTPDLSYWIPADKGGTRLCKKEIAWVVAPPAFTSQGGASIACNYLPAALEIDKALLIGQVEFALGIWPPNDQTDYEQPLEVTIKLNRPDVTRATSGIDLVMFDPVARRWQVVKSTLDRTTFKLTAKVQKFKPVAKEYKDWGGRTFFAVVKRQAGPILAPVPTPTMKPGGKSTGEVKPAATPTRKR